MRDKDLRERVRKLEDKIECQRIEMDSFNRTSSWTARWEERRSLAITLSKAIAIHVSTFHNDESGKMVAAMRPEDV